MNIFRDKIEVPKQYPKCKRQKTGDPSEGRLNLGSREIPFRLMQLIFSNLDEKATAICHRISYMFHQFIDANPWANVRPETVVETIASNDVIWKERLIYFMRTNLTYEQEDFWNGLKREQLDQVIGYLNSADCTSQNLKLPLNKTTMGFYGRFSENFKGRFSHLIVIGKTLDSEILKASNFKGLTHLQLHGDGITEKGLGHLRCKSLQSLQHVTIGCRTVNTEVALPAIKGYINLTSLNLNCCHELKDSDLSHLQPLVHLTSLNFSMTFITGKGFKLLNSLVNVENIELVNCPSLDSKPETLSLSAFPKLRRLELNGSSITDTGLASMKTVGLTTLNLDYCEMFTDAGLAGIKTYVNLVDLSLSCTNVTDLGLPHLADLVKLQHLCLHKTQITNIGLAALNRLVCLETLDVGFCPNFNDEGLRHLKPFENLKKLVARRTAITDQGLEHLKQLRKLRFLYLKETKVSQEALANLKQSLEKLTFY